ncbi:hypothetical protein ACKVMT_13915 [Halobacteriales archaeon Cl-PHB]
MRERIFSALVVLLLVCSALAGPAAAATGATTSTAPTAAIDAGVQPLLTPICFISDGCDDDYNKTLDTMEDNLAVYNQAVGLEADSDAYTDVYYNYGLEVEDTAWLLMEREVAASYDNGTTQAEAKTNAKTAVEDYIALKDANFYERWAFHANASAQMESRDDTIGGDDVIYLPVSSIEQYQALDGSGYSWRTYGGKHGDSTWTIENLGGATSNVTLSNGTTKEIDTIYFEMHLDYNGDSDSVAAEWAPGLGLHDVTDLQPGGTNMLKDIRLKSDFQLNARPPPEASETEHLNLVYGPWWSDATNAMHTSRDEVLNETDLFVDNTWPKFDSGELDPVEILSNVNLANHYQLDATGENTTYSDALAALSASGLSTPPLNQTGWMNISYQPYPATSNTTYQGMLLSGGSPPNGTWKSGVLYESDSLDPNATDVAGVQAIAKLDGGVTTLNGTFTIEAAFDQSGNQIENETFENDDRDFKATNTSELKAVMAELTETLNEIEERQSEDGAGGGSGGGWEFTGFGFGGLLAGLGGVLGTVVLVVLVVLAASVVSQ